MPKWKASVGVGQEAENRGYNILNRDCVVDVLNWYKSSLNEMVFPFLRRSEKCATPSPRVICMTEEVITLNLNSTITFNESPSSSSPIRNIKFSSSVSGQQLPEFLSDSSTISLVSCAALPSNPFPSSRLVAAGGQYLFLARGDALWVVHMGTGISNNRQSGTNLRPIRDMEFNANSSFLVFTDGIDVAVVKCIGISGDQVQLTGAVYMRDVGSESDPVIGVRWHPVNLPSFVTLRVSAGWTLWDLVRLQSKVVVSSSSARDVDEEILPSLFKGEVKNPLSSSLSEGTYPWVAASTTIAGKRMSPGVLAILRRGDTTPQKRVGGGSLNAFQFSASGTLAVASVGDTLRVWSIGLKCSTVSSEKCIDEEILRTYTQGKEVKALVGLEHEKFSLVTESAVIEVHISAENGGLRHARTTQIEGALLGSQAARLAFIDKAGQRENGIVVIAADRPMMLVMEKKTVTAAEVHADLAQVCSLVVTPTAGNPRQFAMYMHGPTRSGESVMWTAQTLDTDLMIPSIVTEKKHDEGRFLDDESCSSSSASDEDAPERVESSTEFGRKPPTGLLEAFRAGASEMVAEVERILQAALKGRIMERIRSVSLETARRTEQSVTESVKRTVRENFPKAMRAVMKDIAAQIDEKIERTLVVPSSSTRLGQLAKKVDDLIARVDSEAEKARGESPELTEIRRTIISGDHLHALTRAAQWWKLNQPIPAGQPDLLAIACESISNHKPAEALRELSSGCYNILVLTEWAKAHAATHPSRTVAVLRAAKYVLSCLFVTPIQVTGEIQELCSKSLSKSVRNAAAIAGGTGDKTLEDLSRDTLAEVRELMMKFTIISRDSFTPRSSAITPSPGGSILQLVQTGKRFQ